MAEYRTDPPAEVPEADLLEQRAPADPELDEVIGDEDAAAVTATAGDESSEADLLEQCTPIHGEEDHPHGPTDAQDR